VTRLNLLLIVATLASAMYLVGVQYESRRLFTELERAQREARRLHTEFERLEVEKRSQATPARVERVAREKGCQPAGSSYPTEANKSVYDNMTWSKFNQYFTDLYSQMASGDKTIQADSTQKCLGVTITQPPADCGDLNGCEVLWYAWAYEWDLPEKTSSRATFYGRQILPTLPNFNTGGADFNVVLLGKPTARDGVVVQKCVTATVVNGLEATIDNAGSASEYG
jgi:cell division protein FtsL